MFFHDFRKSYDSIRDFEEFTKESGALNLSNYFFISISSLGTPNSCSPSSTNLRFEFPEYSVEDMVNFKRRFIFENFKIKKIHGILGFMFGGFEALTWASLYPDDIDFLVVLYSTFKVSGYKYILTKCINFIIESDPNYYSENYDETLSKTLIGVNQLLYANSTSRKLFEQMSNMEIDVVMNDFVDEGLFYDIYDFKYRNDVVSNFDIENLLENIKAKVLVIYNDDLEYFPPESDVFPMAEKIKNCELLYLDTGDSHYPLDNLYKISDDVKEFIKKV